MKFKKIYTKTGDGGTTSLLHGERVPKTDIRIKTVGVLDEVNAALGVAYANGLKTKSRKDFRDHTHKALVDLMGDVVGGDFFNEEHYLELENFYNSFAEILDSRDGGQRGWAIYGEQKANAAYDWAGTVVRRAELHLWELNEQHTIKNEVIFKYINLLSKVLYLLGRL